MIKYLLVLIFTVSLVSEEFIVSTNGGSEEVFFGLTTGEISRNNTSDWHLAFKSGFIAGTIRIGGGVNLYEALELTLDNAGDDLSGIDLMDDSKFLQVYNQNTDWKAGAFNRGGSPEEDFGYGWGTYIQGEGVVGQKLYIIEYTVDDATVRKQIAFTGMSDRQYIFVISDLDGSNLEERSVSKDDFTGKAFGYYNIESDEVLDLQPADGTWDLVFKRYRAAIQAGPDLFHYPVVGLLQASNLWAITEEGDVVEPSANSFYLPEVNQIGYDWKSFNQAEGSYDFTDETYFLQRHLSTEDGSFIPNGRVYRLRFLSYEGGSQAASTFELSEVVLSYSENKTLSFGIYPNVVTNNSPNMLYNLSGSATLKVFDIRGVEVYSSNVSGNGKLNQFTFDISSLNNGQYFVQLINGNEFSTSQFIKR